LANEDNYPVVFHCRAGADRTGFLSYLINGLCGVSYENLTRDYELTTASHSSGYRCRANIGEFGFSYTLTEEEIKAASGACWFKTHETIMNDYADGTGNLSYAIEQYLLDIGVDRNHIEQVKEIMIK
jgi:protein-tyrosine phosphatase